MFTPSSGKRQRRVRRAREHGYSLLELLVVLAILGLIIAIAAPRAIGYFESSKAKTAKVQIANISAALDIYYLSNGAYPSETLGLKALVVQPDGVEAWDGPYLNRADGIIDPWGPPLPLQATRRTREVRRLHSRRRRQRRRRRRRPRPRLLVTTPVLLDTSAYERHSTLTRRLREAFGEQPHCRHLRTDFDGSSDGHASSAVSAFAGR